MHILGTATTQPTMSGMMFACWSIVIVLIAMLVVFMRAEKVNYAVATSPLLIQPLMYVVSGRLAAWAAMVLPLGAVDIRVILNVIAALVACLMLGLTAQRIAEKRARRVFFGCCTGFILLLAVALIINLLGAQTLA